MADNSYYNREEKIKILRSYLGNLFIAPEKITKAKYSEVKLRMKEIESPLTALIVSRDIEYLKLSAAILLTRNLNFVNYEVVDIDSLMNTWLGNDVGVSRDVVKTTDTLVIISFGNSFFKNISGLIESVVMKRQFDGLNTIILTTSKEKAITAMFDKEDIIEFKKK